MYWALTLSFLSSLFFNCALAADPTPVPKDRLLDFNPRLFTNYVLIEKFYRKCKVPQHTNNQVGTICALLETEMVPNGRPNRYLFFRGEDRPYPQPVTSAFFRWVTSNEGPCASGCTNQQMADYIFADIERLLSVFTLYSPKYTYNPADRTWKESYDSNRYRSSQAESFSLLKILTINHLSDGMHLRIDSNRHGSYDPFISFSPNPNTAQRFQTTQGVPLFIASVPIENALVLSKDECLTARPKPGFFYVLYNCWPGNRYVSENEIDAFLFLSSDDFFGRAKDQE